MAFVPSGLEVRLKLVSVAEEALEGMVLARLGGGCGAELPRLLLAMLEIEPASEPELLLGVLSRLLRPVRRPPGSEESGVPLGGGQLSHDGHKGFAGDATALKVANPRIGKPNQAIDEIGKGVYLIYHGN